MKNTYFDLIDQSYYFPNSGFDMRKGYLTFHGISLKYLIEKHGTPIRIMYLPVISKQIKKAKNLFKSAIKKNKYSGSYHYCYCTKCSHFSHVVETALEEGVQLETSSGFDIDLILNLYKREKINNKIIIVHNGYKTDSYLEKIMKLIDQGFENSVIVLDSKKELGRIKKYAKEINKRVKIGIRMAIDEEPQSTYNTSRLGIPRNEIVDFYKTCIKDEELVELKMLHFFVDSGIKDSMYYWGEFQKAMEVFISLKKECKNLSSVNLGGGFPIMNNLGFDYNYEYMIDEIVSNIGNLCEAEGIEDPDIFTEFGKYTVGESGAIIFSVLEQKQQNDAELWYMIDNSLMNTIPDAWSLFEKFILLPINKWENPYVRVNIGGISCDRSDYYNSEDMNQQIHLPQYKDEDKEALYIGFFNTGAYQDSISGYGGIKHCLIPAPKYIIIDQDEEGNLTDYVFRGEQSVEDMFQILGYADPKQ